ncbi:MAG: molybdopterin-dependent oxidoreductase [Acidimicrobiales bacterium]
MTTPSDGPTAAIGPLRAAVSGLVAAAAALSAGELAGAIAAPRPGPVIAVANRVIDLAPNWFVDFGKSVFGLSDKPALVLGTVIIALAVGAGLGIASRRDPRPGITGIAAFGLIGLLAIGTDAQGGWVIALVASAVAVAAGVLTLIALLLTGRGGWRRAPPIARRRPTAVGGDERPADDGEPTPELAGRPIGSPIDPAVSRRSFLNLAGSVTAAAAAAAAGANLLRGRSSAADARAAVRLDSALTETELEARLAAAATTEVARTPGITPIVVPNDRFYQIDTAVLTPQVDPADWELRIVGMVDRERTYTYRELLERATTVEPVTLSCVSNEVGGNLVGNAVWQGVPLVDLLDEAGIEAGATQIASRSVDGWTCGFPTELAYDGRTALVAVAMNDEPLPLRHGFPARLVVSGLYGYVSATKWLSEIELTTLEGFDGYWIPRGWSKSGPVKTQSRIDTPRDGTSVRVGTVPVAGVAWAPDLGIERVEVQIDQGDWLAAELGHSLGVNAWRQWLLPWEATEGQHRIRVRATDGSGETQTSEMRPPAPSGATGWHEVEITVT